MRTIDADELVRDIDELSKDAGFYRPIYEGFKNWINSKQTIDAVPVVRCRECENHSESNGKHYCKFWRMYCPNDPDFFCKAGKRKGDVD